MGSLFFDQDERVAMSDENKPPEPEQESQGSELQHLLKLISLEYESAQRGLTELSYGTSKHEFINQRIENMEHFRERVVELVGDEQKANDLVTEQTRKIDEALKSKKPEGDT